MPEHFICTKQSSVTANYRYTWQNRLAGGWFILAARWSVGKVADTA